MVRTLDIKTNAAHPELPLDTLSVFKSSPFSARISNVPKRIGAWSVTEVFISVTMPSNEIVSRPCVNVSGVWVATLPGCDTTGTSENGYEITANGVDEQGTAVTGYCFGRGDFEVMERDGTIFVGGKSYYFHFLDAVTEHPNKGDVAIIDGAIKWFDGEGWSNFANVDLTPIEAKIAALQDDKRDKDDRAVYKLVKSAFVLHKDGLTDVTLPFIGKDQGKPYPYSHYDWVYPIGETTAFDAIVFSDGQWILNVDDGMEYGYSSASEDALRIEFDNGYVATRSSIISAVPMDDQQLAAVATGDAQTPANGDLVKYEATNDRFVKAVAGVDFRDPQDNTCHKTEYGNKWIASNPPEGLGNTQPYYDEAALYWVWWSEDGVNPYTADGAPDAKSLTFSYHVTTFTATRSAVCSDGKRFVTDDVIFGNDGKPSDIFATDLLGKHVAKEKVVEIIAERVSELDPDEASVYDLIKALKGE